MNLNGSRARPGKEQEGENKLSDASSRVGESCVILIFVFSNRARMESKGVGMDRVGYKAMDPGSENQGFKLTCQGNAVPSASAGSGLMSGGPLKRAIHGDMPPKEPGWQQTMRTTKTRVRKVIQNVVLVVIVLVIGTTEFIVTGEIKGTTTAIVAWLLSNVKKITN